MKDKTSTLKMLIYLQLAQILTLFESIPVWVMFVAIVSYLSTFLNNKVSPKLLRIIAIAGMGGIIYYYRTIFDPEAAVSLLILIGSFKILEINDDRDVFISLLISILFIASMALFLNTFFTFILMFIYMILIFTIWKGFINKEKELSLKQNFTYVLRMFLIIFPLTIILFIFFPRFTSHFLPFGQKQDRQEIGFNDSINNSEISSLNSSSKIAFRAKLDAKLAKKDIYWRGTVHTVSNGIDWDKNFVMLRPVLIEDEKQVLNNDNLVNYQIQLKQNFKGIIFSLDHSEFLKYTGRYFAPINDFNAYELNGYVKVENYSGGSIPNKKSHFINKSRKEIYKKLPKNISSEVFELANSLNKDKNIDNFIQNLTNYYLTNNFKYTLSPGKIKNIEEFLVKKVGFCTHFASVSAILLRAAGHDSRLVSGFQGGEYNEFGDYWIIRDNDAHTWVEYFHPENGWSRYDPTEFISPLRLELGGESFYSTTPFIFLDEKGDRNFIIKNYYQFRLYLDNINYRWNLFMDSFDRSFQEDLAKILKMKVDKFYLLVVILPMLLLGFYFLIFKFLLQIDWNIFGEKSIDVYYYSLLKKLEKMTNKPIIPNHTPNENITYFDIKNQLVIEFIKNFELAKYGNRKINLKEDYFKLKKHLKDQ